MERVTRSADWLMTATELEARALGYEEQSPALLMVFPTGNEQSHSQALADLVSRVFAATEQRAAGGEKKRTQLHEAFDAYCSARELSPRQKRVLQLYLRGDNDKEIAASVGCSEATVYEHWRRMARKAEGAQKADVVTDFHRFLAGMGNHHDTER
jgi:DNA-binding NarL/FixJ family response regulator